MKKLLSWLLVLVLFSLNISVFADEDATATGETQPQKVMQLRKGANQMRLEIRKISMERYKKVKDNLKEARKNLKDYQKDSKKAWAKLRNSMSKQDLKDLKDLRGTFNDNVVELKKEYSEKMSEEESRIEYKEKLEELVEQYYLDMKERFGDNENALELIEARKEVNEKNRELREENEQIRKEFRGRREDMILEYKSKFLEELGKKVERVSDAKLEKVSDQIDKLIERFEANDKISEGTRDKILSQLTALREIVDERIESMDLEDVDGEVE